MTLILVRKLLRDVRIPLIVVALLLAAFQVLWARETQNITTWLMPLLERELFRGLESFLKDLFRETPGKIVQTLIGGETINLQRALDIFSIGYVHPFTQTILAIWAIGRATGAIAGEIDRGTMELLLAQPLARRQLVLAHLLVDAVTIPILCLSTWGGTWLGAWLFEFLGNANPRLQIDPMVFGPALLNVAVLVFAVSGLTLVLSSAGRFRNRVLGLAILLFLVQFLINVVGQLWEPARAIRPFTVFYYFQPQAIILDPDWASDGAIWRRLGVLFLVGCAGYGLACWVFCRRDVPAPL